MIERASTQPVEQAAFQFVAGQVGQGTPPRLSEVIQDLVHRGFERLDASSVVWDLVHFGRLEWTPGDQVFVVDRTPLPPRAW